MRFVQQFLFFYRPATRHGSVHTLRVDCGRRLGPGATNTPRVRVRLQVTPRTNKVVKLVDTSQKQYDLVELCGFRCMFEESLLRVPEGAADRTSEVAASEPSGTPNTSILDALRSDLSQVCRLLSLEHASALRLLQTSTRIWVNETITFGAEPGTRGRACCYHDNSTGWLQSVGMRLDKAGGVEIYCAADYLRDRGLWGVGGVMMHELAHAYHNKHLVDSFDNELVLQSFRAAMGKHLYDAVGVHGRQGVALKTQEVDVQKKDSNGAVTTLKETVQVAVPVKVKAYACSNCMEFFAELSTAFMWSDFCLDCGEGGGGAVALAAIEEVNAEVPSSSSPSLTEVPTVAAPSTEISTGVPRLEFNKWYPHNRAQIAQHDPATLEVLSRLWAEGPHQVPAPPVRGLE